MKTATSPQDWSRIEPLKALDMARRAMSIEEAWSQMQTALARAGFNNCAFAIARRSVDAPVGHPDTQYFGQFVSDAFVKALSLAPEIQRLSSPLRRIRHTAEPIAFFGDIEDNSMTGLELAVYREFTKRFGIKGRAIAPFHAPGSDCLMAIGWWDIDDVDWARAHWAEHRANFCLATTYFCQGILDRFNPIGEDQSQLTDRESECLLWAAAGRRTCEIAAIIGVAETTVDEYVKRAMKKLRAQTRSQACAQAVANGLHA